MRKSIIVTVSMLMAAQVAIAQNTGSDWVTGVTDDKLRAYAGTTNDSGSSLIEACDFKTGLCTWYVVTDTSCEKDALYPALGNTETSAAHITIQCDGTADKGRYRYVFRDWKDLEGLSKSSQTLGLAFPMASGRFNVYRFSLKGMLAATEMMESSVAQIKKSRDTKGTSTIVL